MDSEKNFVVTIGRQFGSGGRVIGKMLAERLGIAYYDKELLSEAAKHTGLTAEYFQRNDERFPTFFNGLYSFALGFSTASCAGPSGNTIGDDSIYCAQSEFIMSLARRESCVIVGRTADYVLRDFDRCINVFVHAPIDVCVERIVKRDPSLSATQARKLAEKTNKLRANYYNFYTDKTWGAASSYDITVDTSLMPIESIVAVLQSYVEQRLMAIDSRI